MSTYRIYERDEIGRIVSMSEVQSPSDGRAYAAASRMSKPNVWAEIWCGNRFVAKVSAAAETRLMQKVAAYR